MDRAWAGLGSSFLTPGPDGGVAENEWLVLSGPAEKNTGNIGRPTARSTYDGIEAARSRLDLISFNPWFDDEELGVKCKC